ncbi:MAG TPA: alpha/beta hydrolase [Rhizomicrobium sp.]|nr:alpha/beta hydrolase [Rhizomicrobium sp.]
MSARGKPPVLMIHGAFAGPFIWEGFAAKFREKGYVVHTPALRHHGDESRPEDLHQISLADYADDLDKLIGGCPTPPILVGHAMGGLLAQMLAARAEVCALILLAPSAPWGISPSSLFEIASAQAMLLNVGFWNSSLEPKDHILPRHGLDRLSREEREALLARLVPESGRAVFEIMHWGLDMRRASEVDGGKVTSPLLVLAGSEDRINPPGTVERVAGLYGRFATYEKIPGMSHWLMGEPGWEKIAGRALEWLDEI